RSPACCWPRGRSAPASSASPGWSASPAASRRCTPTRHKSRSTSWCKGGARCWPAGEACEVCRGTLVFVPPPTPHPIRTIRARRLVGHPLGLVAGASPGARSPPPARHGRSRTWDREVRAALTRAPRGSWGACGAARPPETGARGHPVTSGHSRPLGGDAAAAEYRRLSEPAYHGSFISRYDGLPPEPPAEPIPVLGALAPSSPPRLGVDLGGGAGTSARRPAAHADKAL